MPKNLKNDSDLAFQRIAGLIDKDDAMEAERQSVKAPERQSAEAVVGSMTPPSKPSLIVDDYTAEKISVEKPPTAPAQADSSPVQQMPAAPTKANSRMTQKSGHVHGCYWVTPDEVRALKHRAYVEPNLDLSGHVRAALDAYLAKDLEAIKQEFNN